jgi:hypothetical protein
VPFDPSQSRIPQETYSPMRKHGLKTEGWLFSANTTRVCFSVLDSALGSAQLGAPRVFI